MTLTLIFRIGDRAYGLDIDAVQEIMESPPRYPVPKPAPFLEGAINAHGEVLPVIDLPALMDVSGAARDARLVVLAPEFRGLALLVSRVERIVPLDLERSVPDPDSDPYCQALIERDDSPPVRLLDVTTVYTQLEQLFNDNGGTLCP